MVRLWFWYQVLFLQAQAKAKPKEFRILLLDDEEHKIQITPNTTAQQFA